MVFEFNPSKMPPSEDEPDIDRLIEEEKERIKSQNPERLALFEKFLSVDKTTYKKLPLNIRERYGELEEDWFNISDVCDRMGGEEKYRKIISDIEDALVDREQKIGTLKEKIAEIGVDRLCAYFDMKISDMQATADDPETYDSYRMRDIVSSKDPEIFDKCSFELIDQILRETEKIDIATIDQRIDRQKIVARQAETSRLKIEKVRVLRWLQKMYGAEWKMIVRLCQVLNLVKDVPKNGEMLNQLQPQELLVLERRYRDVENKLREYDMHLWNSSDEDLEVVIEEVLQSAPEK